MRCLTTFHPCAEDEGKPSRKRGRPEEASAAAEGISAEDTAPNNKVSRTGRVIVPPALREEALTSALSAPAGRSKGRVAAGTGVADAAPEDAAQPMEAQQKGRRKGKKTARRVEWPPAAAEQLAAAHKVRLSGPSQAVADPQSPDKFEDMDLLIAVVHPYRCWMKSQH